MEITDRLLTDDEISGQIWKALVEKTPLPPQSWSVAKLNREVFQATSKFEPEPHLRQKDALETAVFFLSNFANGMPERVNLTESNQNTAEMCEQLTDEIERITFHPEKVIAERGKLKVWLVAILAAGTCWIYQKETERFNSERESLKTMTQTKIQRRQTDSGLASELLRKVLSNRTGAPSQHTNQQRSLF